MPVDCPHCSKPVSGWVPEDRLSEMAKAKREATQRAEAAEAQAAELQTKATQVDTLTTELAEVTAHAQKLEQSHTQQLGVYKHGITDSEDVADIIAIYERRAPEGVALSDWLGSDSLPRSVSALLSKPATATPVATGTADPGQVVAPTAEASPATTGTPPSNGNTVAPAVEPAPTAPASSNAGVVPTPPARAIPSAQEINRMTTDQYKAHRDQLLASLTQRGPTG